MDIPYEQLSPEALRGLVEEFVLREGTDYGSVDYSLEEKTAHVMKQLEKGLAKVVFDPELESCNIVRKTRNTQE